MLENNLGQMSIYVFVISSYLVYWCCRYCDHKEVKERDYKGRFTGKSTLYVIPKDSDVGFDIMPISLIWFFSMVISAVWISSCIVPF
jgi:hypothetical protein